MPGGGNLVLARESVRVDRPQLGGAEDAAKPGQQQRGIIIEALEPVAGKQLVRGPERRVVHGQGHRRSGLARRGEERAQGEHEQSESGAPGAATKQHGTLRPHHAVYPVPTRPGAKAGIGGWRREEGARGYAWHTPCRAARSGFGRQPRAPRRKENAPPRGRVVALAWRRTQRGAPRPVTCDPRVSRGGDTARMRGGDARPCSAAPPSDRLRPMILDPQSLSP